MHRRTADRLVLLLLAGILFGGAYTTWSAYQRMRVAETMMGSMMGGSMNPGITPFGYAMATVVATSIVGGVYVVIRDDLTAEPQVDIVETKSRDPQLSGPREDDEQSAPGDTIDENARPDLIDVLPDDERRILEPIISSPGITQIALRDRSGFSKSKVSQTVSALEKRGLLYRERQGRTYRLYPDDSIAREASQP